MNSEQQELLKRFQNKQFDTPKLCEYFKKFVVTSLESTNSLVEELNRIESLMDEIFECFKTLDSVLTDQAKAISSGLPFPLLSAKYPRAIRKFVTSVEETIEQCTKEKPEQHIFQAQKGSLIVCFPNEWIGLQFNFEDVCDDLKKELLHPAKQLAAVWQKTFKEFEERKTLSWLNESCDVDSEMDIKPMEVWKEVKKEIVEMQELMLWKEEDDNNDNDKPDDNSDDNVDKSEDKGVALILKQLHKREQMLQQRIEIKEKLQQAIDRMNISDYREVILGMDTIREGLRAINIAETKEVVDNVHEFWVKFPERVAKIMRPKPCRCSCMLSPPQYQHSLEEDAADVNSEFDFDGLKSTLSNFESYVNSLQALSTEQTGKLDDLQTSLDELPNKLEAVYERVNALSPKLYEDMMILVGEDYAGMVGINIETVGNKVQGYIY